MTLLRERGIDWNGVSQRLVPALLLISDLVLVMTRQQQQLVRAMLANMSSQHISVELLSDKMDIADPYGENLDSYRRCMQALETALKHRLKC